MLLNHSDLLPIYHNGTMILIDDEEDFLLSLKSSLNRKFAVRGFTSPTKAYQYIMQQQTRFDDNFQLFESYYDGEDIAETGDDIVLIKSSQLKSYAFDIQRYGLISIVIIDQMMPSITGLELCKQLEATGVKIILLTGQMADADTIAAFNEGLIDGYVNKKDENSIKDLIKLINKLNIEFFIERLHSLKFIFDISSRQPLGDFQVQEIMQKAYENFPFSEYYYIPNAPGFLLVNEKGERQFCLFDTEAHQKDVCDSIHSDFGDIDLVKAMKKGELICWDLLDDTDIAFFKDPKALAKRLFLCHQDKGYRWALIPIEKTPLKVGANDLSWKEYQNQMEQLPLDYV